MANCHAPRCEDGFGGDDGGGGVGVDEDDADSGTVMMVVSWDALNVTRRRRRKVVSECDSLNARCPTRSAMNERHRFSLREAQPTTILS